MDTNSRRILNPRCVHLERCRDFRGIHLHPLPSCRCAPGFLRPERFIPYFGDKKRGKRRQNCRIYTFPGKFRSLGGIQEVEFSSIFPELLKHKRGGDSSAAGLRGAGLAGMWSHSRFPVHTLPALCSCRDAASLDEIQRPSRGLRTEKGSLCGSQILGRVPCWRGCRKRRPLLRAVAAPP